MSNRGRGRGGGGTKPTDRSSSSSPASSSRNSSITNTSNSTTTTPDAEQLMKQYQSKIGGGATGTARPTIRVAPKIPVSKKEKEKTDSTTTTSTITSNNDPSSTNTKDTNNGNRPQSSRGGRNNNYRDNRLNYVQTTGIFESSAQIPVSLTSSASSSSSSSTRTPNIKREATESSSKTLNLKKFEPKKTVLIGDVDGVKYEIDEEYEPRQIPIAERKSIFDSKKESEIIQKKKEATKVNSEHIESFVQLFAQQKFQSSTGTTVKEELIEPTELPKTQEPIIDPSQLILMQFPDVLPCTRTSSASNKPELTSLSQLPDGFLGKLQIYKSGKCRLKLNDDTYLDVDIGQPTSFLQNVMVTEMASASSASSEPGTNNDINKLVCLGDIKHKLIVSLDVDHVLQDTRQ